jgi:hypothetical protein
MAAIDFLRDRGADQAVTVQDADYVFVKDDPLIATFEKAIAK